MIPRQRPNIRSILAGRIGAGRFGGATQTAERARAAPPWPLAHPTSGVWGRGSAGAARGTGADDAPGHQRDRYHAVVRQPQHGAEQSTGRPIASRPNPRRARHPGTGRAHAGCPAGRPCPAGRSGHDRSRQGALQYRCAHVGGFRTRPFGELPGSTVPEPARCFAGQPVRQCIPARPRFPRIRRLAGAGNASGARRVSERRPHQRGLRRCRQLELHSGNGDPAPVDGAQQPHLRPQRSRRRPHHRDEERLHLPGQGGRSDHRLLRPPPGGRPGRLPGRQFVGLCQRRRHQRQWLA